METSACGSIGWSFTRYPHSCCCKRNGHFMSESSLGAAQSVALMNSYLTVWWFVEALHLPSLMAWAKALNILFFDWWRMKQGTNHFTIQWIVGRTCSSPKPEFASCWCLGPLLLEWHFLKHAGQAWSHFWSERKEVETKWYLMWISGLNKVNERRIRKMKILRQRIWDHIFNIRQITDYINDILTLLPHWRVGELLLLELLHCSCMKSWIFWASH